MTRTGSCGCLSFAACIKLIQDLGGLSADEKLYYAVEILEGEVHDGGYDQFFWNSLGNLFREAVAGLKVLAAGQALDLLLKATKVSFPNEKPPVNWEERRSLLRSHDDKTRSEALDPLDHAFWKEPGKLGEKLTHFSTERGLITPFIK